MPISISDCSFMYRRGLPVLDGLSLSFGNGATVLLGPNGAGKSTLLGIAASALRPASGHVRIDGLDTHSRKDVREYRRRVGWLPQQVKAVPGLRVREQVAHAGWLKGMSRVEAWDASRGALDQVDLTDLSTRRTTELSGGQKRRLGIAQALVHSAEVVLMDEPTAGLDPSQRATFRDLVARLSSTVAIVVSTHQTEDLADIYQSVVVLDQGCVRHQGGVSSFLDLAPIGTPAERQAEAAYATICTVEV
ncbi:ATP-binding cassette domain-containing protein [Streptomyces noursei]|uniref:ATP-binding cassette domain-containing protein n=1 Tax=Streptomyces noursei TaxID=1971 RepID=UPI001673BC59|nr:ATP-binding cassette domain-containing protein [Streptomyces noursei]MCZ1019757.1 ATP-binding cassette domain-containing protein [Streptomyces noursei]GGX36811.1 ABC transporter ATP-binding protein [Streptomyces noursei]